jgi:hypothetical protein
MVKPGIDITGEFPRPWTDEVVSAADVMVTIACDDVFPGKRYLKWILGDHAGRSLETVRPSTTRSNDASARCSPSRKYQPADRHR